MKRFQKTTVLLLALVMLLLFLPNISVSAADSDMRYGRKVLGTMSNGAALQYAYDKLAEGCATDTPTQISLSHPQHKVSITEFTAYVFPMFYGDYPEYFWLKNGGYTYSYTGQNIITIFTPGYYVFSNLTTAKNQYNTKVQSLTSGLTGSDYDKAKTLHDRLIQAVTYTSSPNDQNPYGALVEGKAVCNGYARAYQHLLQTAGIPAWYVRGSSTNPTTGNPEDHAWNLVKLDGQWYYTDITWDDQGSYTFYAYFNITSQQLLTDHVIDSSYTPYLPQATATANNYFVKEDRIFSAYDRDKLVQLLKKDNKITQFSIAGDKTAFLSALKADLLNVGAALGGTGGFQISYSVSMLGKAMILSVVLVEENHVHQAKTSVPQVDATCLSNGTKGYYICDCGHKFFDQGCTQQISNDSELTISVLAHTPSDWQKDGLAHWKQCSVCGSETANTRAAHTDGNGDNKCDTCGYALPVADKDGNVTVENTPESNTNPTSPAAGNTEPAPTEGGATQSTDANTPQTDNAKDPVSKDDGQSSDGGKGAPVVIGVLLSCGVIAAGAYGFIKIKKKNSANFYESDSE